MVQKGKKLKVFLDANVLLRAFLDGDTISALILKERSLDRLTNEYAIKEIRRVSNKKKHRPEDINAFIDLIHQRCTVLLTPSKEEFSRYRLSDKSDRPHVASAVKAGCPLVTHDRKMAREAVAYVEVLTAVEVLERLRQVNGKGAGGYL